MSRRILVAIPALAAVFAACGAIAQSVDAPSPRWIAAVSGKAAAATKPVRAKSDRVVNKEAKPVAPAKWPAPKLIGASPVVEPAVATAPRTKEAKRSAPAVRRVGKKSQIGAETPRTRSAHRRVPAQPVAKHVVHVSAPMKQAVAASRNPAPPIEAPKPAVETRHLNGRPDIMAQVAREERSGKADEGKPTPGAGSVALSMILKLAVVLGLAYLTVRVLKWFNDRRGDTGPRLRKDMKVVDTIRLSNTNSVHLLDIKGKTMLVGCSAGQVTLLGEFEGAELPAAEEAGDNKFAEYLAKYSGAKHEKTPAGRVSGLLRDCTTYLRTRQLDGSAEEGGIADEA